MRALLPGILTWSVFSDEKGMPFNGWLLRRESMTVLIDPPDGTPEDVADARRLGAPFHVLVTNRDHRRASAEWRERLGARVWAPEADAPLLGIPVDEVFRGGDPLPAGLRALHLTDQKSPGEAAFHLDAGDGVLFVGDAVLGDPPGSLRFLPPAKFRDPARAREALHRLEEVAFEALLMGDGTPLLRGGKDALRRLLRETAPPG